MKPLILLIIFYITSSSSSEPKSEIIFENKQVSFQELEVSFNDPVNRKDTSYVMMKIDYSKKEMSWSVKGRVVSKDFSQRLNNYLVNPKNVEAGLTDNCWTYFRVLNYKQIVELPYDSLSFESIRYGYDEHKGAAKVKSYIWD